MRKHRRSTKRKVRSKDPLPDPGKGHICPRCGKRGSKITARWVLNDRKHRYEPYYYVGHSVRVKGLFTVKWCYIPKKGAQALMDAQ